MADINKIGNYGAQKLINNNISKKQSSRIEQENNKKSEIKDKIDIKSKLISPKDNKTVSNNYEIKDGVKRKSNKYIKQDDSKL